jgi:hypothetical protein
MNLRQQIGAMCERKSEVRALLTRFCDATQIVTDETHLHGATPRYKGANRRGGGGIENFPMRNKTSSRRRVTSNPVAPL